MRVLLTGVTGYIGKRLLPVLLEEGHEIVCCVRDAGRFDASSFNGHPVEVVEVDFLHGDTLNVIPDDIDVAYYLIHSMTGDASDFPRLEAEAARHFSERLSTTKVKQVVYLSGIVNDIALSKHLQSRYDVEKILSSGRYALTTLRAGIIVGSGSASFEIIRDLVEKLPLMIAPKWLNTKTQPIAIRNVIQFLHKVMMDEETFNGSYDIGGPEVLSYREMLLEFAEVRELKRIIITFPFMTPRLSSYWLFFVTSTSYKLASSLVNSMKVEVIAKPNNLHDKYEIRLISYREAIKLAFGKIQQQEVASSWKDAQSSDVLSSGISKLITVPEYGCFKDRRIRNIADKDVCVEKIWAIGGDNGWYSGDWLWHMRGFIDKLVGGVGLRRGRRHPTELLVGDSLDFWRVLFADKSEGRLLLYAEMKLPGEAWLEFKIAQNQLIQTATLRPRGVWGRLYWYAVLPFHGIIFNSMIRSLTA